jgi:hypothetical protein
MTKRFSHVVVACLIFWQCACGGGAPTKSAKAGSPGAPPPSPSANISITPTSAAVGSPDLGITILASHNFTFSNGHRYSVVLWSQGYVDTQLVANFVSNSELTAIVPAALLASPVTGNIRVETWDLMENTHVATSSSVPFQVTSTLTPTPSPSISSISPPTVVAGSQDVTITIDGSNFGHFGHFAWSTAFWTTNGNLHDTGTWLQTTILSNSQLTAVIPAELLQSPTSVQIVVMNGDVMGMSDGYFGYPRSNAVTFEVTP